MKCTRNVLVAISSAHAASRQKLRGIYRYAARMNDWDITLVRSPTDLNGRLLNECAHGAIDGFILSSDECSAQISRMVPSEKPIVAIEVGADIHTERKRHNTIALTTDNEAIGMLAAEHFRSLGHFASFVYIPDELDRDWSEARGRAFAMAINRRHVEIYDRSRETLAAFLSRQEQPVAAFAAWDFIAAKVVRACHESRLAVPSQVSVIGVDDDDLVCESVRPPLSTILVDRVRQGFVAAKTLDAMMKNPDRAPSTNFICRPLKVIERESTTCLSSGAALVERARIYISDNIMSGIGAQDIADAIHVSRRLLDLRFAESGLGSVSDLIRKKRLAAVKKLLKQTSLSDSRIATRCGFKNVGTMRNLFRRVYGMSPSHYRDAPNPRSKSTTTS